MILDWIQSTLGTWGSAVLQFYLANSLWINLIIVAYGAWILLSWTNLKRIRSALIWSLVSQLNGQQANAVTGKQETVKPVVPWQSTVAQSRFPFISHHYAFLPRRLSVEAVQRMLPAEDLIAAAEHIIEQQSGKKRLPRKGKVAPR